MESPIIPLGDKIVILPQEEGEQTYGNIIVPDTGQEKPEMGKVLAVGPGRISTDGTLIPNRLEVGQTKRMSVIKDPIIAPYEIQVEEDQYVLVDTEKDKPLGYYSDITNAIQKISRLGLANAKEEYTLAGFIESFNNIKNKLTNSINN